MTKRKSKNGNKLEDGSFLLESPVPESRRSNGTGGYVLPCILFLLIALGGSTVGWFCTQQQNSIDQLSESFTAMQMRMVKVQQGLGVRDAQLSSEGLMEERLRVLEEAQRQGQVKTEVVLATAERLQNSDLSSQIWALRSEMDVRLAEMQQVAVSTEVLWAAMTNHSQEVEAVKQSLAAFLSSNSALAVSVAGLTGTVTRTRARLDQQLAAVDGLAMLLEGQVTELGELRGSLEVTRAALETNNLEVVVIKDLLVSEQAKRALALEEKLQSVKKTLDEHHSSSHSIHMNLRTKLEAVHSQLVNEGQPGSEPQEEVQPEEEALVSEEKEEEEASTVGEEEQEEVTEEQEEQEEEEQVEEQEAEEEELLEEEVIEELPLEQEVEEEVAEEEVTEEEPAEQLVEESLEEEVTEEEIVEDEE